MDNIYAEGSLVQILTSLGFLISSLAFIMSKDSSRGLPIFMSFSCFYLAFDEHFMIHECLKMTLFRGWHSSFFRDTSIFFYGVSAILFLLIFRTKLIKSRKDLILISLMTHLALVVVALDVFGIKFFGMPEEIEEVCEMLIAFLLVFYSVSNFKIGPLRTKLKVKFFVWTLMVIASTLIYNYFLNNFCKRG